MNKCPKCGYERKPGDIECPRCGIVYEKYEIYITKKQAEEESKRQVEANERSKTKFMNNILGERKILFFIVVLGAIALFSVYTYTFIPYNDKTEEQKKIEPEREQIRREPERKTILVARGKKWEKLRMIEKTLIDYRKTHTYSMQDFFVCADMAIEVWNLLKTKGINAKIQAGIVDKGILFDGAHDFIKKINHAWVLAEYNPLRWVALETTGGYMVYGETEGEEETALNRNNWYYSGFSFSNPREFKAFIELRKRYFELCNEADQLMYEWNTRYVGRYKTYETARFRGMVDAKAKECEGALMQLIGFLKTRGYIPKAE